MPKTYAYQHYRTFPYYKVQLWDAVSLCWFDIQASYPTQEAATVALPKGKRARLMCIEEGGRYPLGETVPQ